VARAGDHRLAVPPSLRILQLVDDVLDFTAREKTLGKPVGGDLREGKVTLDTTRESMDGSDWILFRVSDTGIGLNPDQIVRLFQAFSLFSGKLAS
jgi:signal transduction histidine kinase